jgi:hypothetical protein
MMPIFKTDIKAMQSLQKNIFYFLNKDFRILLPRLTLPASFDNSKNMMI